MPYDTVRGAAFYRQFLDVTDWPRFMLAGYEQTRLAFARARRTQRTERHRQPG